MRWYSLTPVLKTYGRPTLRRQTAQRPTTGAGHVGVNVQRQPGQTQLSSCMWWGQSKFVTPRPGNFIELGLLYVKPVRLYVKPVRRRGEEERGRKKKEGRKKVSGKERGKGAWGQ